MTDLSVRGRLPAYLALLLITVLLMAGCGRSEPTPTPTPIPPTATPTPPPPTATPTPDVATDDSTAAVETETSAEATPVPTPDVTIPAGFIANTDNALGYSLALPNGWTEFDLRSDRIQSMAGNFGFAEQMAPLNEFLDSPEGEAVGIVAMTDLAGVMFGGVPTLLNVSVVDSPGATPDSVLDFVQTGVEANASSLGDVQIESLETATINNLPAVQGTALIDLSSFGLNKQMYAKFVGLIANDKIYALTLATDASKRADSEATFNDIIGSFRPE